MTPTLRQSKPLVKECQVISLPPVNFFSMSNFGERLKIAFNNARNAEIARKLGVSEPAVKKYLSGSMPNFDKLVVIRNLTGRSLDWLITGEEAKPPEDELVRRMREIAREEIAAAERKVDTGDDVDEMDVTIEPVSPKDVMIAPVVAHIGPATKDKETGDGETAEQIRARLIGEAEVNEIERRLGRKKKTG